MEHLTIKTAEKNGFDIDRVTSDDLDRYTFAQACEELGVGDTKLRELIRELAITPEREGKTPYLSQQQFLSVERLNAHRLNGGSIQTFRQLQRVTKVPQEKETSALALSEPSQLVQDKYWGQGAINKQLDTLLRNSTDAMLMSQRQQAYAQLEIRFRTQRDISDSEVKELFGWKPPRTGFREGVYQFNRYSKTYVTNQEGKLVKETTWMISKFDPAEEKRKKAEKRAQRKLKAQQKKEQEEEEEAIKNMEAIKDLMADERAEPPEN